MENPTLPTNWLAALSNANHNGTTQQIDDAVGNFETENQVFLQKAQAVHQTRVQEDDVWQKSQVDPVVKQLEAADKQQGAYMTAFRYINDGYAALPDGEAQKTDALVVQRTFKDFKFRVNDGYGAEADKILQMGQNLQTKQEFLTQIGAWQWYVKAAQAAQQVRYLLGERAKTKGEFVKGELKAARWSPNSPDSANPPPISGNPIPPCDPSPLDFTNRSRKQPQRPRISGIRGHYDTKRGWISGIETGNGHCESGLQESE